MIVKVNLDICYIISRAISTKIEEVSLEVSVVTKIPCGSFLNTAVLTDKGEIFIS